MIVSCPACEGRFEVEKEQLGYDGRIVRCGKCGNCWHQMPEEEPPAAVVAEPPPPPPSAPKPPRRPPARAKKGGKSGVALGWVALLVVLLGAVAGAWFGRNEIVAQFPQTETVYAALGIPVTQPGPALELRVVAPEESDRDGDRVLTFKGSVVNISKRKQVVPKLQARLTDQNGAVLLEWEFQAPKGELDAGAAVDFATEAVNPPRDGQNLTIRFLEDGEESS